MPLEFDTARVSVSAAPQRTDITCFVGYVRTRNAPLPRQVTEDLRAAGWIDGPWRRSEAQTPHARAAAGRRRELGRLRSALRLAFQARGGRQRGDLRLVSRRGRAALLRAGRTTGDRRARGRPLAVHGRGRRREPRTARRASRRLVPQFVVPSLPFDPTDPRTWRGIQHLYGLPDASLVCLPDLADACGDDPAPPDATLPLVPISEGFVECSHSEAVPPDDLALRYLHAPRCGCGRTARLDQRAGGGARVPAAPQEAMSC